MNISASCVYNLNSIKALSRLTMFGKKNPMKRMKLFGSFCGALIIVIIVGFIAFGNSSALWAMFTVLIISALIYCYMFFILPIVQYKSACKFADIKNNYLFTDDALQVSTDTDMYKGNCIIKYEMLIKVAETDAYLFLYQNKRSVFLIDKTTINSDEIKILTNRLSQIVPEYIKCNY